MTRIFREGNQITKVRRAFPWTALLLMLSAGVVVGERADADETDATVGQESGFPRGPGNDGGSDGPTVFDPKPMSADEYVIGPLEIMWVKAPDGADMYVEVHRPVVGPKGIPVPARVPVVLDMSPYKSEVTREQYGKFVDGWRARWIPKGYAFALSHGYGTGNSEGCLDFYGSAEVAAASAVVEALGTAPWSNGRVGMLGGSYDGGYAVHVAARGSPAAKEHLAAISVDSAAVSSFEYGGHDGLAFAGAPTNLVSAYAVTSQAPGREAPLGPDVDPAGLASRQTGACRAGSFAAAADFEATGDFSQWYYERSARRGAGDVQAAVLMFQGFHDGQWGSMPVTGFFDFLPKDTPHKLVIGHWGHAKTLSMRADYWDMIQAWFDRYLLDLPVETESWPPVQAQDSSGVWRIEKGWPATRGPVGQLALDAENRLGAEDPSGSTTYLGAPPMRLSPESRPASFSTGPLAGPLHIAGQPVLDLWVVLDRPDTIISLELAAFTADGTRTTSAGFGIDAGIPMVGYRSARHLEPIDAEFRQMEGKPAPVGIPVRIPVRFYTPMDLVVPAGGWITVEVAGSTTPYYPSPGAEKGAAFVKILHDCDHVSALRFLMPKAEAQWLTVPTNTTAVLTDVGELAPGLRDGGGLASAKVCEKKPLDPQAVMAGR